MKMLVPLRLVPVLSTLFLLSFAIDANGQGRDPIVEHGTLTTTDDQDGNRYYEEKNLQVSQGERVIIDMTSDDFDTYLEVYDSGGTLIDENDDKVIGDPDAGSHLELTLDAGRYKVRAISYDANEVGDYELIMSFPAAAATTINERGSLTTNDKKDGNDSYYEEFNLNGTSGQRVIIDMTAAFDTVLELYDASGTLVAENDDDPSGSGTDSKIDFQLPANGRYTIRARSFDANATGDFDIVIGSAIPQRDPIVERGTLSVNDDKDGMDRFYEETRFNAIAGQRVTIDMTSADFDTYLEVYDSSGTLVPDGTNDDKDPSDWTLGSRLTLDLPNGRYTIRAVSYNAGELGNYTLTLTFH